MRSKTRDTQTSNIVDTVQSYARPTGQYPSFPSEPLGVSPDQFTGDTLRLPPGRSEEPALLEGRRRRVLGARQTRRVFPGRGCRRWRRACGPPHLSSMAHDRSRFTGLPFGWNDPRQRTQRGTRVGAGCEDRVPGSRTTQGHDQRQSQRRWPCEAFCPDRQRRRDLHSALAMNLATSRTGGQVGLQIGW